jgi:DivIVA domain-containing protein
MTTELTPALISAATFRTVRKGYDPDEVHAFLARVADALEIAQQQAVSMEARARAAVARLQELTAAAQKADEQVDDSADATPHDEHQEVPVEEIGHADEAAHADEAEAVHEAETVDEAEAAEPVVDGEAADVTPRGGVKVSPEQSYTISRTLLLAQRTADTTVAEAKAEADRIKQEAQSEAEATIDSTREMSARLLEEARTQARMASEAERLAAENEVQSLKARREFLVGDVNQLEMFLEDERERLRSAARQIEALCDRVPDGLGTSHPPILSASDDEPGDDTSELFLPPEASGPFASVDELAEAIEQGVAEPLPTLDLQPYADDDTEELESGDDLPVRGDFPLSD